MPKILNIDHYLSRLHVGLIFAATVVFACSVPVISVHAQLTQAQQNAQLTASAAGVSEGGDLLAIIGRIINIFLGTLGVVFLVLLLYAGYLWMTASGDVEQVKKAKVTIRNAVIGLIIIASAWAIVRFVFNALAGTEDGFGGSSSSSSLESGLIGSAGALGSGIIESHLPGRNATGIPRNTPIIITFKEPIKPESFIAGWTEATSSTTVGLNIANIKVYRTDSGAVAALSSDKVRVRYTKDLKTYVLKPVEYLGSPTENMGYTVELKGGLGGIQKMDGSPAFSGAFGSGYTWAFEVSTVVDLTPPRIISAIPQNGGQYARNIILQINFNEPVDPTAVTGKTQDGFLNIQALSESAPVNSPVGGGSLVPIEGEFRIANQYQTVEFVPSAKCGTNSCGRDVFCLPGNQAIQMNVKAATVDPAAVPQGQLTNNGYDGVVDVAGNSLDGNANGVGEGAPTDNYSWGFGTTNDIKLAPPQIESTVPSADQQSGTNSNVPLDQSVVASFDSLLQASTLTSENVRLDAHGKDETDPDTFWWTIGMSLLNANGAPVDLTKPHPDAAVKEAIVIDHRPYLPSGEGVANLNFYDPYLLSGIQDAYQNCFNPAAKCGTGVGSPNCCNDSPSADPQGCKSILHP